MVLIYHAEGNQISVSRNLMQRVYRPTVTVSIHSAVFVM